MDTPISRRQLLKQGIAVAGVVLVGPELLAACASASASPTAALTTPPSGMPAITPTPLITPTPPTGTVAFWQEELGSPAQRQYWTDHYATPFMKDHPEITLDVTFRSFTDYDRVVRTALQAGTGPDLVLTAGPASAQDYANAGLFLPLDNYSQMYSWPTKIQAWALGVGKTHGKLYTMPTAYQSVLTFYNKTLFDSKGWKPPTNRAELEALATEAMGMGIIPFCAGNAEFKPALEWLVTVFLNHYAGPTALYQALTGQLAWTDPVFVDAITLLNGYFQKGWFGGGVDKYFTNKFAQEYTLLGQGKAAMNLEGTWWMISADTYFGSQANNQNQWDWASSPSLRSEVPYPFFELGIGRTISINNASKVPDAAATFLNWEFSDPKRAAQSLADVKFEPFPIHLSVADFPSSIDARVKSAWTTLDATITSGNYGYVTWTFWPPKTDQYIYEGMEKVITGKTTPAQYCADVNTTFKAEAAQGLVPALPSRT